MSFLITFLNNNLLYILEKEVNVSMIWMWFFWIFVLLVLVTAILSFSNKTRRDIKDISSDIYFFALVMMGLSLLMSIATKDPFLEGLPLLKAIWDAGWEVGLSVFIFGISLFGFWMYLKHEYLKPIRDDVTGLQREVSTIDERTKNIDKNVDRLLQRKR